jgi:hypothetical protein
MLHRYISIVMFAAAAGISTFALWRWNGEAGSAWPVGGLLVGVVLFVQKVQAIRRVARNESMAPTAMTRSSRYQDKPIF